LKSGCGAGLFGFVAEGLFPDGLSGAGRVVDGLVPDGLFTDGLLLEGFDGFLSAGLISALGLDALVLLGLVEERVDLDVEDEREFPRDCASISGWKAVNANPISIAANVVADNLIVFEFCGTNQFRG
jgi:hypothetical protein